jgi:uncharacterized delta-60 repeat protein
MTATQLTSVTVLLLAACTDREGFLGECDEVSRCGPTCQPCSSSAPLCGGISVGCVCTATSCPFGSACDGGGCQVFGVDATIVATPVSDFADGGILTFDYGGSDNITPFAQGPVVIDAAGRVVVSGGVLVGEYNNVLVARFFADGSALDPSFGDAGVVVVDLGSDAIGNQLAVDPGSGLFVGVNRDPPGPARGVLRLLDSGDVDVTFGTAGYAEGPSVDDHVVDGLQRRPGDGYLFLTGQSFAAVRGNLSATVFRPDGSLAAEIGSGGTVSSTYGFDEFGSALLFVSGGFILGGQAYVGGSFDFTLVKFTDAGAEDPSFASGGHAYVTFSSGRDTLQRMLELPDGRILAAGYSRPGGDADDSDWALAVVDALGELDPTFGSGGRATFDFGGGDDSIADLLLFDPGRVLVLGSRSVAGDQDLTLAMFNLDGSLDQDFADNGFFDVELGSAVDHGLVMLVDTDNTLVVGGLTMGTDLDIVVVRLRIDPG